MRRTAIVLLAAATAASAAPTFNKDIAPILYRNCVTCHRPGEVAPFSLLTYADASKRASLIARVTASRYMPPWRAEPGYGDFQDARRLSDADIATLEQWAGAGAPEGKAVGKPAPPHFTEGWQLGPPDLVVKMPEPFSVPADGPDVYQCFVIPLGLTEDKFVSAVEIRPGNRRVLHHSIFYVDTRGTARAKDAADPAPGYRCFGGPGFRGASSLGGWAPGPVPRLLPAGVVHPLKQASDLVIQNHYHPDGKPETDQSTLGIYFSKTPPRETVFGIPLMQRDLYIPAGEKRYRAAASFTTPIEIQAIGITPHMHLLGREMKVTATVPDGRVEPLIWIKDWNFNWQGQYRYKKAVTLPRQTRIDLEAWFDNSADNIRNPHDPPQPVRWGEQTTDEMCIAFIQCATPRRIDGLTV
ncbi:MAG TPA: hypothetical protein VEU62_12565, partial [Bryobacterales bacterium]|nr:hypothetical protein [Bryobacterales bacterium]